VTGGDAPGDAATVGDVTGGDAATGGDVTAAATVGDVTGTATGAAGAAVPVGATGAAASSALAKAANDDSDDISAASDKTAASLRDTAAEHVATGRGCRESPCIGRNVVPTICCRTRHANA